MPRFAGLLIPVLALVLLSATFVRPVPATHAQDATPQPDSNVERCTPTDDKPEYGQDVVSSQLLAQASPDTVDFRTLTLVQYTLAPDGDGVPRSCYPEIILTYVQSGELTITVYSGEIEIRRAGDEQSEAIERIVGTPEGESATVGPGDSFFSQGADYSLQNVDPNAEPAVLLVTVLGAIEAGWPYLTWPT